MLSLVLTAVEMWVVQSGARLVVCLDNLKVERLVVEMECTMGAQTVV